MSQGGPQPAEGALVSRDLLRLIRDGVTEVEPQKIAVSVDPSGGRDTAGVVGGFLGADNRVWITHDRSAAMSSAEWSTAACLLAYATNAAIIYVEGNYGRDMCVLAIRTSWDTLQREDVIPKDHLMPGVDLVFAKQGKLLRAEPIAQQMVQRTGYGCAACSPTWRTSGRPGSPPTRTRPAGSTPPASSSTA